MTELEKYDTNGNGVIDPEELALIELEDRRRRMEDDDAKRDSQRRMAWFALVGLLVYPLGVLLASLMGLSEAANIIGDMAGIYFVSIAALVGTFFGVTNIPKAK
jgi:hypothetical protein